LKLYYLEPIPKIDRIIANCYLYPHVTPTHEKSKNKFSITKIPDKLWDEVISVLPAEKPDNTIGRPIVPYRKAMDGIVYVLRKGISDRSYT
jgi:hypothetical protein